MKIITKIKVYSILSWVLIALTLLLAIVNGMVQIAKTSEFTINHILGFFLEIVLQPYLWIALILRWRIKANKNKLK